MLGILSRFKRYGDAGADEITFLDITASHEDRATTVTRSGRSLDSFYSAHGGWGISTLEDIRTMLNAGADKVSINTAAVQNPEFVREAAERFGSQCIVVAVDAKRVSAKMSCCAGKFLLTVGASRPGLKSSNGSGVW